MLNNDNSIEEIKCIPCGHKWPEIVAKSNKEKEKKKGIGNRETIFTCLYPYTVQTRLSRDQRPTKPVSRLGTGREVGGNLKCY